MISQAPYFSPYSKMFHRQHLIWAGYLWSGGHWTLMGFWCICSLYLGWAIGFCSTILALQTISCYPCEPGIYGGICNANAQAIFSSPTLYPIIKYSHTVWIRQPSPPPKKKKSLPWVAIIHLILLLWVSTFSFALSVADFSYHWFAYSPFFFFNDLYVTLWLALFLVFHSTLPIGFF